MRLKIALRNLIYSQLIILIFLVFAYFIWFPYSFATLGGFYKTALMLIFVDLVLGPLLVFIIFKEGKKYLNFDMNVLLSIQIIAFIFGAYSLFLKHPAYAVFTGDRFTLTNVSAVYPPQPSLEQLKSYFFSTPKWVVAKAPEDSKKRNILLFDVLLKGAPDIDVRPSFYQPFKANIKEVFTRSINLEKLFIDSKKKQKITQFLDKQGGLISDYAFFPLQGNNKKDVIWVHNRVTAEPVGIIDVNPWVEELLVHSLKLDSNPSSLKLR